MLASRARPSAQGRAGLGTIRSRSPMSRGFPRCVADGVMWVAVVCSLNDLRGGASELSVLTSSRRYGVSRHYVDRYGSIAGSVAGDWTRRHAWSERAVYSTHISTRHSLSL